MSFLRTSRLARAAAVVLAAGSLAACGSDDTGGTATGPDPATTVYPMSEVQEHSTDASCWVAVDGAVYDLTEWVGDHPGGSDRILDICGTDATEAFEAQHASSGTANSRLTDFQVGTLEE